MPYVALFLWVYSKPGKYLTYLSFTNHLYRSRIYPRNRNRKLISVLCFWLLFDFHCNSNRSVAFEPSLPVEKEKAIQNLGIGVVNKVVLVFNDVFWDNVDYIGKEIDKPSNILFSYLAIY